MIPFGGSQFTNCSVPLAFEGHYFILEPGNPPLISVVREDSGQPVWEIVRNKPAANDQTTIMQSPAGIVTVSDKRTGKFIYKVRPGSQTSVVFGKVDGSEFSATITDSLIMVGTNKVMNCTFNGVGAGVVVRADGGMAIGGPVPESLRKLLQPKR